MAPIIMTNNSYFFNRILLDGTKNAEEVLCKVFLAIDMGFHLAVDPAAQLRGIQAFLTLLKDIQEEDKDV